MVAEGQRIVKGTDMYQNPYIVVLEQPNNLTILSEHKTLDDAREAALNKKYPVVIIEKKAMVLHHGDE